MTTNGDMSPRQPDDREPPENMAVDELDFIDETSARITDAEVKEQLRRVLDQSGCGGPVPEHLWRDRHAERTVFLVDMCPSTSASVPESASRAADILAAARLKAKLSHDQMKVARQSIAAARQEAEQIVAGARAEADAEADAALERAAKMIRDAREKAKQIISDAHSEAEQIIKAARNRPLQPMAGGGGNGAAGLIPWPELLSAGPFEWPDCETGMIATIKEGWIGRTEEQPDRRWLKTLDGATARSGLPLPVNHAADAHGTAVFRAAFAVVEPGDTRATPPALEVKSRSRDLHALDGMANCQHHQEPSLSKTLRALQFRDDARLEQIGELTVHAVRNISGFGRLAEVVAAGHPDLAEDVYVIYHEMVRCSIELIRDSTNREGRWTLSGSDDEEPPREIQDKDQLQAARTGLPGDG